MKTRFFRSAKDNSLYFVYQRVEPFIKFKDRLEGKRELSKIIIKFFEYNKKRKEIYFPSELNMQIFNLFCKNNDFNNFPFITKVLSYKLNYDSIKQYFYDLSDPQKKAELIKQSFIEPPKPEKFSNILEKVAYKLATIKHSIDLKFASFIYEGSLVYKHFNKLVCYFPIFSNFLLGSFLALTNASAIQTFNFFVIYNLTVSPAYYAYFIKEKLFDGLLDKFANIIYSTTIDGDYIQITRKFKD
jgi:hypothetical protein